MNPNLENEAPRILRISRIINHLHPEIISPGQWKAGLPTVSSLRGCLKKGRDRFASGHAECASRLVGAAASGCGIPQRSGEWNENAQAHEMLGNHAMTDHSHPILADLPEVGPCLSRFFRQPLSTRTTRHSAISSASTDHSAQTWLISPSLTHV